MDVAEGPTVTETTEAEWQRTKAQIEERWDQAGYWNATRAADLEILKPLRQELVREALRLVLHRYSSADQRFNIKWVMDIYNELLEERYPKSRETLADRQAAKLRKIQNDVPYYTKERADILVKLKEAHNITAWRDRFLEDCGWADEWGDDKRDSEDPAEWGPMFCGLLFSYMSQEGQAALAAARAESVELRKVGEECAALSLALSRSSRRREQRRAKKIQSIQRAASSTAAALMPIKPGIALGTK
jgi:hypothetical protein